MSKVRFRESSVLLRVIQRYTRLDSPLFTPGLTPTTLIPLVLTFTELTGIAEDLLCAVQLTNSCEKRIKLNKMSSLPQRMRWWQRRKRGHRNYTRDNGEGGRGVPGRRGHIHTLRQGSHFPFLGKNTGRSLGFYIPWIEIDTSVNSPNQIAFYHQAVSAHLPGENLWDCVVLTVPLVK